MNTQRRSTMTRKQRIPLSQRINAPIFKPTSSVTTVTEDGLTVVHEVMDVRDHDLAWRIIVKDHGTIVAASHVTSWYPGILSVKYRGRIFAVLMDYWKGALPTEQPFEIIPLK